MATTSDLLTVKQASEWASEYLQKKVTPSNISYLVQYGRVKKVGENGSTFLVKEDLIQYYQTVGLTQRKLGNENFLSDINKILSFDSLKESERTKHVHRLHPYKGKFIPQLVEYFLDGHTDSYKENIYFSPGDIILDPFAGSGTTLVQANELGMHAIGIDISSFNSLICNVKISKCSLVELYAEANRITRELKRYILTSGIEQFQKVLDTQLNEFNKQYFPSPDFKLRVYNQQINEFEYGKEKELIFQTKFIALTELHKVKIQQDSKTSFLGKWYTGQIRSEIDLLQQLIARISDSAIRDVLTVVLSRTTRSCRATTHFDLATLKQPIFNPYYCHKHGKICKPLFSSLNWWMRYCEDTIERLAEFQGLRTETQQLCITGDARTIDISKALENINPYFAKLTETKKIRGIFTSPPYVGLIDYHDQHAYAYDLFKLERNDDLEITPLSKGQGLEARKSYIESLTQSLENCKRYLVKDYDIFIVANDKYKLYPIIADNCRMKIVKRYERPVLCRTERDKGAYAETIFHLKER